ncbi:MAG TPA: NAD(P)/FAD-dependent oxidoreductase, partial [Alicycliphilus sp.]|nr:NAD(P)/FAD-dependent oxidoreductase [Alicycliphilus sp.]
EAGKVVTEGGEIPADLILFMPGMTGNAWFDATTLPRSPGGLLRADAQCRVEGWQHCYVVGDSGSFPGPEWAPKQAHMADLHARAAAQNLLDGLAGRPELAGFVPQLACIIDSGSHGTLVLRNPQRTLVLPPLRLMHWAKRAFEGRYLRQYR